MNQQPINHDLNIGFQTHCQICGSDTLELIINLGHQPPCDSLLWSQHLNSPETNFPLRLVRCQHCSLAQIDYVVSPELLFYADYPYRSGITNTLAKNLRETATTIIERYHLKPGAFVVDIGSNDGTLLSGFRDAGMKPLGIEPTKIANIANENGIETWQLFFNEATAEEIVKSKGNARVVTAANMFAHVAQLGQLIRGVEKLLSDDGVFVTESHYLMDLLDTVQYDSIYHEHLKYYSLKSLIQLFSYYNFTVVDVDRIENYGGSIRVYAAKGKGKPISNKVAELLQEEEQKGLYHRETFIQFANKVKKSKQRLQKFIVESFEQNKRVVGVGCPGRSSTLVNFCNIDNELMPYIAEQSNSLKLGLHLPGKHIPIVDEEILFRDQPEYVMMLSWHYWKPIVKKLREKGLKSKIVIPLPTLQLVED